MAQPKVSVVIPVYNTARYLKSCLDSIISQTLDDIEIICIDDGSTDVSLEILRDYEKLDNRIRVFTQQNGGAAVSRNRGMRIAVGEYLYFCDSDDYIVEDALTRLYMVAQRDNLDILAFGGESFFESSELEKRHSGYKDYYKRDHISVCSGAQLLDQLHRGNKYRSSVPMQFFRRAFLVEHSLSFPESMTYEDELFTPSALLLAERAACIPDVLYMRRVRTGSAMTASPQHQKFDSLYTIYAKLLAKYISEDYDGAPGGEGLLACVRGLHWESVEVFKALPKDERGVVLQSSSPAVIQIFENERLRMRTRTVYKIGSLVIRLIRKGFQIVRVRT